ncbi:alpha-amylase A-like [Tigriopus californicus]|uniref:alpha-amylase A-like n=1 Tax=Tigriopus californicus TaxID=6832 RepID=UPI0027D9F8CD|nr:alpha-amylase A-like [Tigriopus californicus]
MWVYGALIVLIGALSGIQAQDNLAYTYVNCDDKQALVHLFEWSWDSVARECEEVLGPKGYCGVQVSPPHEHIVADPWWARYQAVSYQLNSRGGDRAAFIDMVNRCNAQGVNVVVDVVMNHMTGRGAGPSSGWGGSPFNAENQDYPGVPFSSFDFHQPYCEIFDYNNPDEVRNCGLLGMNDLNHGNEYVQDMVSGYLNDLIDIGVKGFRIDATKHMWPGDLEMVQSKVKDVAPGLRPYFIHEVIDHGNEPIHGYEYFNVGKVTEFNYGGWMACIRNGDYNCLNNLGDGLSDGVHALVFIDNHDNQRGHGGAGEVLTHREDYLYKVATAVMLAHDYGFKRVMSSYYFDDSDQGPPGSQPPSITQEPCGNGWVCEHRWAPIMNMVQFANAVIGEPVENWQVIGDSLGFSRGSKGFVAVGGLNGAEFYTGLPDGEYCDIIHECAQKVTVSGGKAFIKKFQDNDGVVAFYVGA